MRDRKGADRRKKKYLKNKNSESIEKDKREGEGTLINQGSVAKTRKRLSLIFLQESTSGKGEQSLPSHN